MNDSINSPKHYNYFGFETIDLIEALAKEIENKKILFHLGNCLKYILRSKQKGRELEDLQKAEWYLLRINKYCSDFKDKSIILNENNLMHYLGLISRKDFDIFIIVENIVNFSLNTNIKNYNNLLFNFKRYIKGRI